LYYVPSSRIRITADGGMHCRSVLRHWRLSPKIKAPACLTCRWLSAHPFYRPGLIDGVKAAPQDEEQ
jgi:hypothetical protein